VPEPIQFVDLKRQYASIKDEVDQAVIDAIASTQYILGEEVARFEEEWAAYCSVTRPRPEPQVRARSRSAATSASTRSRPPCCA